MEEGDVRCINSVNASCSSGILLHARARARKCGCGGRMCVAVGGGWKERVMEVSYQDLNGMKRQAEEGGGGGMCNL